MAGSVNKAIILGRLGNDPVIRTTQDGREIASLSVATSQSWKDRHSGERIEKVEWHRISIYNENLVNVAKNYLSKGSRVYLEGQLQTRKYKDQSGVEKYTTEIVLQAYNGTLTLMDSKRDGGEEATQSERPRSDHYAAPSSEYDDSSEIPF